MRIAPFSRKAATIALASALALGAAACGDDEAASDPTDVATDVSTDMATDEATDMATDES